MSPNVGNFVHDLVEMAKAMETLPQVQLELDHAKLDQHNLSVEIDRLKADLEQSRNYAATLEQKVRTVEAERDDAEIRFLELDEKTSGAVHQAMDLRSLAESLIARLDPPKPQAEPVVEQPPVPEAVHSLEPQPQGQGEATPTEHSSMESGGGYTLGESSNPAPQPPASQDQSEVNPTAEAVSGQSPAVEQVTASGKAGGETEEAKPSGPYTGKRYKDVPYYVSFSDWLAGGGISEDYTSPF